MYIKIVDNQPKVYNLDQLRADNPNVSFPQEIPDNILAEYNVYRFIENEKPIYDSAIQKIEYSFQLINNFWYKVYTVINKSVEEAKMSVRERRNSFLRETDWTGLSDVTMTNEFASYRQQLRDVPQQSGFPFNVVWPEKPLNI